MTRTAELTAKLLDGLLSDAEGAELAALLASDPAAEAEHLELLEVEAVLRGLRTDFDLADATLEKVREAQAEKTADAVLDEIASGPPPAWATRATPAAAQPPPSRRRRWVVPAALVACAAALVVALWLGARHPNAPAPPGGPEPVAFATLAHKAGAVEVVGPGGDAVQVEEGGELPAGFTLRTIGEDSLAVVELLRENTRVEIEPDSVVRFAGDGAEDGARPRLFLAAGQLTAAVRRRPDDRPLVVGTSVAEVFARGGTFVVSSAGPDSMRVDNRTGNVELVRADAPRPVPLGVGGAAVFHTGMGKVQIERAPAADRVPRRTLAFPGPRDAVFSADGSEVWVANARAFTRWGATGGPVEKSFYPRRGNDGVAAFTRDRRLLVTFRGDRDDRVLVRTLPDGGEHAAINARPAEARFWAVAPDGAWLAVVDPRPNNRRVRVLDGATGEERFAREFNGLVTCVAATPDGKGVAVAVNEPGRPATSKVVMLDAATSDRLFALSTQRRPVTAMAFSADGRFLAAGFNGTVQLWDVGALELVRSVTGFERALTCLAFSPDGKTLAAGTPDGHVWVWDADTGKHVQLIELGGRGVRCVSFSPDGRRLVTVSNAAPVAVWDVAERPAPGGEPQ
jgi:hypothetical protein